MNRSEVSGVVFLDLKKAFDLFDHDILLKKLNSCLKNSCSLPLFKSCPDYRTQCVLRYDSHFSEDSAKLMYHKALSWDLSTAVSAGCMLKNTCITE